MMHQPQHEIPSNNNKHALNLPSTPPEPLGPACCEMGGCQGSIEHISDEAYEPSKQPQVVPGASYETKPLGH